MNQKIALIAAISENHVLGKDNKLVWELPADWENFKRVTKGKPFILGRVSYESEDMLYSDTVNVVLTRQKNYSPKPGDKIAKDIPSALALLANEEVIFILGGGKVFAQSMEIANYLYLTIVHDSFTGDSFFPPINWDNWQLVKSVRHEIDERHQYSFSLNEYQKVSL